MSKYVTSQVKIFDLFLSDKLTILLEDYSIISRIFRVNETIIMKRIITLTTLSALLVVFCVEGYGQGMATPDAPKPIIENVSGIISNAGTGTGDLVNIDSKPIKEKSDQEGATSIELGSEYELSEELEEAETVGEEVEAKVFPNPAINNLKITFDEIADYKLELINIIGQTVDMQHEYANSFEFQVSSLPPGIYLLRIEGEAFGELIKQVRVIH